MIRLRDMYILSYTRKIGLLNFSEWETIKTTYFWQTCTGPEISVKNICFHHKKLFGKSFEEPNNKCCNVFNTHKSGTVSHSPIHKNKHWIYCLKTKIWGISRPRTLTTFIYSTFYLIFCGKMENHRTSIHEKLSHVFLKINEYQK